MGQKLRILVHTMHETESNDAEAILGESLRRAETVIEGFADSDQIQALRGKNYVVEAIPEDAPAAGSGLYRGSATLDWGGARADSGPALRAGRAVPAPAAGRAGTFSLRMVDPTARFSELLGPGAIRVDRILGGGFGLARLDPDQRRWLEADDRIDVVAFNLSPAKMPAHELTPAEREAIAPATGAVRKFDLVAHSPDRTAEIEAWARAKGNGIAIVGVTPTKVRIRVADTSPLLDEAEDLDAVFNVVPVPKVRLCLDHVRPLVGLAADPAQPPPAGPAALLDGADETVGMIDGIVDGEHPDLAGRVHTIGAAAGPPSAHGTHVAGIMIGNGSCSNGTVRGIAPAARLAVEALATAPDGEIDLDVDFVAMLERLYQADARIVNLSFEEDSPLSFYSQLAEELDAFAVSRPDMLIVVAAGNGASTEQATMRALGEVGLDSISAPGVAKNALAVGASCSDRRGGGHAARDWHDYAPARFVTPPTSRAALSGDAAMLAAFSGRGWGQDNRIKPELVAPGTNVVAARARGVTDALWGAYSPDYCYSGGTSMAAPVVSGCAALVRQYYRQRGHPAPSAALLRATLANGATWLVSASASQPPPPVPIHPCANLDQGFGRVNVPAALGLTRPGERLCFVDVTAAGNEFHTIAGGTVPPLAPGDERRRFWFTCEPAGEVDIALCYVDPVPGPSGAVLSLMVQAAGQERRVGNDCAIKAAYPPFGPAPDRVNTLQLVRLGVTSGKVEVQVGALALLGRAVGFALVVRGPVKDGLLYAY